MYNITRIIIGSCLISIFTVLPYSDTFASADSEEIARRGVRGRHQGRMERRDDRRQDRYERRDERYDMDDEDVEDVEEFYEHSRQDVRDDHRHRGRGRR